MASSLNAIHRLLEEPTTSTLASDFVSTENPGNNSVAASPLLMVLNYSLRECAFPYVGSDCDQTLSYFFSNTQGIPANSSIVAYSPSAFFAELRWRQAVGLIVSIVALLMALIGMYRACWGEISFLDIRKLANTRDRGKRRRTEESAQEGTAKRKNSKSKKRTQVASELHQVVFCLLCLAAILQLVVAVDPLALYGILSPLIYSLFKNLTTAILLCIWITLAIVWGSLHANFNSKSTLPLGPTRRKERQKEKKRKQKQKEKEREEREKRGGEQRSSLSLFNGGIFGGGRGSTSAEALPSAEGEMKRSVNDLEDPSATFSSTSPPPSPSAYSEGSGNFFPTTLLWGGACATVGIIGMLVGLEGVASTLFSPSPPSLLFASNSSESSLSGSNDSASPGALLNSYESHQRTQRWMEFASHAFLCLMALLLMIYYIAMGNMLNKRLQESMAFERLQTSLSGHRTAGGFASTITPPTGSRAGASLYNSSSYLSLGRDLESGAYSSGPTVGGRQGYRSKGEKYPRRLRYEQEGVTPPSAGAKADVSSYSLLETGGRVHASSPRADEQPLRKDYRLSADNNVVPVSPTSFQIHEASMHVSRLPVSLNSPPASEGGFFSFFQNMKDKFMDRWKSYNKIQHTVFLLTIVFGFIFVWQFARVVLLLMALAKEEGSYNDEMSGEIDGELISLLSLRVVVAGGLFDTWKHFLLCQNLQNARSALPSSSSSVFLSEDVVAREGECSDHKDLTVGGPFFELDLIQFCLLFFVTIGVFWRIPVSNSGRLGKSQRRGKGKGKAGELYLSDSDSISDSEESEADLASYSYFENGRTISGRQRAMTATLSAKMMFYPATPSGGSPEVRERARQEKQRRDMERRRQRKTELMTSDEEDEERGRRAERDHYQIYRDSSCSSSTASFLSTSRSSLHAKIPEKYPANRRNSLPTSTSSRPAQTTRSTAKGSAPSKDKASTATVQGSTLVSSSAPTSSSAKSFDIFQAHLAKVQQQRQQEKEKEAAERLREERENSSVFMRSSHVIGRSSLPATRASLILATNRPRKGTAGERQSSATVSSSVGDDKSVGGEHEADEYGREGEEDFEEEFEESLFHAVRSTPYSYREMESGDHSGEMLGEKGSSQRKELPRPLRQHLRGRYSM